MVILSAMLVVRLFALFHLVSWFSGTSPRDLVNLIHVIHVDDVCAFRASHSGLPSFFYRLKSSFHPSFVCDTQSCPIFISCSPCPEHVSRGWCIFVLFLPHQCCIRLISTHNHCRFYLRDSSIVNSPGACLGLVMCCISPHTKPRLIYAWNYGPEFGQERLLA